MLLVNLVYHFWIAIFTLALCFIIHCPRPFWLVCQTSKPESYMYGSSVWFPKAFGKFSWWQGQSERRLGDIWMWHCQENLQMIFIAKSSLTIGPKNVPSEFSCKISFHMNPVLIGKLHDTFLAARMVGVCHQSHTGVESGVISWNVFLIFAHSCAKMGKFDTVDLPTGGVCLEGSAHPLVLSTPQSVVINLVKLSFLLSSATKWIISNKLCSLFCCYVMGIIPWGVFRKVRHNLCLIAPPGLVVVAFIHQTRVADFSRSILL